MTPSTVKTPTWRLPPNEMTSSRAKAEDADVTDASHDDVELERAKIARPQARRDKRHRRDPSSSSNDNDDDEGVRITPSAIDPGHSKLEANYQAASAQGPRDEMDDMMT